mmetsp:Transcript_9293/g.16874  ORF Transcript_9293/g.16874 Transcript_9293/m.16874 type:complete len:157 (+) Transcript_9293:1466-1936(+)
MCYVFGTFAMAQLENYVARVVRRASFIKCQILQASLAMLHQTSNGAPHPCSISEWCFICTSRIDSFPSDIWKDLFDPNVEDVISELHLKSSRCTWFAGARANSNSPHAKRYVILVSARINFYASIGTNPHSYNCCIETKRSSTQYRKVASLQNNSR